MNHSKPFWALNSIITVASLVWVFQFGSSARAQSNGALLKSQRIGDALQKSFVWIAAPTPEESLHAGFRRTITLASAPTRAQIHLFAYTRYHLFVNGNYIGRGPNRFENSRPEYDTWDIANQLHAGFNVVAVLVHRDWPGNNPRSSRNTLSRFRQHDAGFTALVEIVDAASQQVIATDDTWRGFTETGFAPPPVHSYSSIPENYDAQRSPGEWTSPAFDDGQLPAAVKLDTSNAQTWPTLFPRTIPLLRESKIAFSQEPGDSSQPLTAGRVFKLQCGQIVQAYWVFDFDADAGTKIVVTPLLPEGKRGPASVFNCRAGAQRWIGGDTFAFNALSVRVETGKAVLRHSEMVEVLYPFERIGTFSSSDGRLDKIWKLTARSLELLSEDAYTDCADRERSEWMDNDPPMYDATRVMEAGPGVNGAKLWSDPRLFKNLLRRVALTQESDGMLRARTCSELVDIHTRMEDRACAWVEGLRKYYEATGDDKLIRELWPACEKLLQWFADRRRADGLIEAREWIAWDNPMSYATCEGAANNAFIWRAFRDAGWLGGETGNAVAAAKWGEAAEQLQQDFNRLLWDDRVGAYCAAVGTPKILPGDQLFRKSITLASIDGRIEPTLHANLFALDRGIVPSDRFERVMAWTRQHDNQIAGVMANYYYFKLLYNLDQPEYDQIVLDRIRNGWHAMTDSPWQTTWEAMSGGSKIHCYGIVPGYVLSSFVLGVRRDAPVAKRQLVVEPHLADLTWADGVVVTEFGPVPVSWKIDNQRLSFKVSIPPDTEALLALPCSFDDQSAIIDNQPATGTLKGLRCVFRLGPGQHSGNYRISNQTSNDAKIGG